MKYLIYMSTSVGLFSPEELKQLLTESQANNALHDITGMLLYSEGSFVQVLEGEDAEVDNIYAKIQKDARHKNIIKITEDKLDKRLFPNWSMGFKTILRKEIAEFEAYIDPKAGIRFATDNNHPAIVMLQTFADTNFPD